MIYTILKTFATALVVTTSIYDISVPGIAGNEIRFNDYRNKKILLVNICTGGPHVNQLAELEQLYQRYKDSLVIIAFPSNSFNNETHTNEELASILNNTYHISFPVASKSEVVGQNANSVYKWLSDSNENGVVSNPARADFQKYLINGQGRIIGIFRGLVSPLDSMIQKSIIDQY